MYKDKENLLLSLKKTERGRVTSYSWPVPKLNRKLAKFKDSGFLGSDKTTFVYLKLYADKKAIDIEFYARNGSYSNNLQNSEIKSYSKNK